MSTKSLLATLLVALTTLAPGAATARQIQLLNVSYDPTRELWRDLNSAFRAHYRAASGDDVAIRMSHGGSSSQARAVIDGIPADVVTLALWSDIDAIRTAGLIANGWEDRLPARSLPYTSTIVFVVRAGNPKGIRDWPDLARPDVTVMTPNPKTSGNGRLSFLAAWGSVVARGGGDAEARALVEAIYRRVPVLDSGARGCAATFLQRGIGDVQLAWESEARLEVARGGGEIELVMPPLSILAEPPVAVVDSNTARKGSRAAAEAYLAFLYTPEGQEIIARHFYRPSDPEVLSRHRAAFPDVTLFPITALAADWNEIQRKFFADGGVFDQIYAPPR